MEPPGFNFVGDGYLRRFMTQTMELHIKILVYDSNCMELHIKILSMTNAIEMNCRFIIYDKIAKKESNKFRNISPSYNNKGLYHLSYHFRVGSSSNTM